MTRNVVRVDPSVLNGNPYISCSELTVFDVVSDCRFDGVDGFSAEHPEITRSDLIEILRYCANRSCDVDGSHCGGCSLRPAQDGIRSMQQFIDRFSEIRFADSEERVKGRGEGVMVMPGTVSDLPENWRGENGWEIAKELLKDC